MMLNELSPTITLLLAITSSMILAGFVIMELIRFFIKKKDRMFWNGLVMFAVILFLIDSTYEFWDMKEESSFMNRDDIVVRGYIQNDNVREKYAPNEESSCLMDGSEKQDRCLFLARAESQEKDFLAFIQTKDEVIIRVGHWPFSKYGSFSIDKPTEN